MVGESRSKYNVFCCVSAWKKHNKVSTRQAESGETEENDINEDDDNNEPVDCPRYLRVNTLRTTTENVMQYLRNELHLPSVQQDAHIPDLLVLPREATPAILQQSDKRYDWVLQDKSSCFSAYCLVHGFATTTTTTTTTTTDRDNQTPRVYLDACKWS